MSASVLAVSIGVNLLVFTVVNALWVRPLPFPEPERVVTIPRVWLGPGAYGKVFEDGAAWQVDTTEEFEGLRPRIEIAEAGPNLETLGVTSDYFGVLRLALRGRDFTVDDDRDGSEPVAIISDRLWNLAFGRRPEVVGSVLDAHPIPLRVIGVAPPAFKGARRGEQADLWIPTSVVSRLAPADWAGKPLPMMLVARLGRGQTVSTVEQRLKSLVPGLFLASWAHLTPLNEVFGTPDSPTCVIREGGALLVVSGLALFVLLGGCATIAALVLMHYERRRTELAVKMALGAGRRRLLLELGYDLSLLAAVGTAAALLVAAAGTRVVPALSLPGGVNIGRLGLSIDWRVCLVAIAVTAVTLVLAAGLPLVRTTRLRFAGELLAGASATTLGSLRVRQALLAVQVCSTVVVLVAAGLLVKSVSHAFGNATGFDVGRTVFVSIPEERLFPDSVRAASVLTALERLPGVREVAEGIPPIGARALSRVSTPQTVTVHDGDHQLRLGVLTGSPSLLSALGVPILAGRPLTAADSAVVVPYPAVITRSLAERLWPDERALGQTFSLPEMRYGRYLVVGIAADFAFGSLTSPGNGVVVCAVPGPARVGSSFVVRTDSPEMVSGLVSRTIKAGVVVATGREVVAEDVGRQRLGAWLFSGFGLAALLLGVGGAFGLVAYLAESRRREFGVRMALGADLGTLVRHGLTVALRPVAGGVAAGLAIGAVMSRLFSAALVGVSALDAVTYLAVAVTMTSCAAIAALAAAWRLRRTSPADALRAS
jgi:predicted permease